ncbi:hypothetical protein BpHYR1_000219 [Brachionus plicatilis]|uniref:Uncharacterized protein n=1 Tax=Brachionus plicatilis TaxID=10195 RepID=A0A3M7R4G7_BRAPC|nr:hypothetical protein BpHYR1_000219 [Brachionus plicatilis]
MTQSWLNEVLSSMIIIIIHEIIMLKMSSRCWQYSSKYLREKKALFLENILIQFLIANALIIVITFVFNLKTHFSCALFKLSAYQNLTNKSTN